MSTFDIDMAVVFAVGLAWIYAFDWSMRRRIDQLDQKIRDQNKEREES